MLFPLFILISLFTDVQSIQCHRGVVNEGMMQAPQARSCPLDEPFCSVKYLLQTHSMNGQQGTVQITIFDCAKTCSVGGEKCKRELVSRNGQSSVPDLTSQDDEQKTLEYQESGSCCCNRDSCNDPGKSAVALCSLLAIALPLLKFVL